MNKKFKKMDVCIIIVSVIVVLLGIKSAYEKKVRSERSNKVKTHPTKYTIHETKRPSQHYVIFKVLLNDKDIGNKSSYKGLGRSICNLHGENKSLCSIIFTSQKFKNAFETPDPDYSADAYGYASATYNSSSGKTLYSCFYFNDASPRNCSLTTGNKLLVEKDNIPSFEYSSISYTKNTIGERIYTNNEGSFHLTYYAPEFDKFTDVIERPAMYDMDFGWRYGEHINLSCSKGSKPVMKFDGIFADKETRVNSSEVKLNRVITYRLDKNTPKQIKQSLNSFLITSSSLNEYDIILSPSETDKFMKEISRGNSLVLGKYHKANKAGVKWLQLEIGLQGLTKSWNQLKVMCNS